jgi:hypothetical protein
MIEAGKERKPRGDKACLACVDPDVPNILASFLNG